LGGQNFGLLHVGSLLQIKPLCMCNFLDVFICCNDSAHYVQNKFTDKWKSNFCL
jgi:hypothetical protein